MNKRFLELAEQAREEVSNIRMVSGQREMTWLPEAFEQRFAELIVRECSKWVNDNLGLLSEDAETDLLKHFGVEE